MKILVKDEHSKVEGMANLNPQKSGLSVVIWSEHSGITRNKPDSIPRVKIFKDDDSVSVSISDNPEILAETPNIKKSVMNAINKGIKYVARNYDIFLKHYMDKSFLFDDEALFDELRARGEYK
jgi:hypothetical protein